MMRSIFRFGFNRSPPNRFKGFDFDELEERVHTSSMDRLRKFTPFSRKLKKLKHKKKKKKINQNISPVDLFTFKQVFTGCTKSRETEICNEPIDVDSQDGLDTEIPQIENNNEAIDLDAEVTCDTKTPQKEFGSEEIPVNAEDSCDSGTIQYKIRNEPTDVDTEVKHSANSAEKDVTTGLPNSDACCQVCMTPENCASSDCAYRDHFVSGSPVAEGKLFGARSPNYEVTTSCSENDVSINNISDDDEWTEISSSSYVPSPKQNEVLLRGVPGHDIGRHFHKFYPKGEHDAVAINQKEIELLQPERFINDSIIDFYINHLKNKIEPDKRQRFHFFNCFFFRKLSDLDKKPFRACEGRTAFERVRKWTKEVNLFEKDYVFIPINFKCHWSLIVICHPGEVVTLKEEEVEISPKVPCILHLNSIKGSHRGLKNLFQSYLCELWKEKHDETGEEISSKFLHLKFIQLELPQQGNWYDCGFFLLHYIELFLREAPVNFNPLIISAKSSNFLSKNWFPPAEASRKRAEIRELINGIFENGSLEVSPAECCDRYSSMQLFNENKQEAEIESVDEICQSTERCHVSTPRSVHCTRDYGDKYSTAACQMNMMPPIEELDEEDMVSGSPETHDHPHELNESGHLDETGRHKSPLTCKEEPEVFLVEDSEETSHEFFVVEDSESDDVQESTDSAFQHDMYLLRPRTNRMIRK